MKKRTRPIFTYCEETGVAECVIQDPYGRKFEGTAYCHPDDIDMMSETTGCNIAALRAEVKSLKSIKNNEIKPALKALNQLYYSMNKSKNYNPKSYEATMLRRQIAFMQKSLEEVNELIKETEDNIQEYITAKDNLYNRLRKIADENN